MAISGFMDMPTKHKHLLTIRQLLSDGRSPDAIKKAIGSIAHKAGRKENPIEDALSYLVTQVGRDEDGWGWDDYMKLNE